MRDNVEEMILTFNRLGSFGSNLALFMSKLDNTVQLPDKSYLCPVTTGLLSPHPLLLSAGCLQVRGVRFGPYMFRLTPNVFFFICLFDFQTFSPINHSHSIFVVDK